MDYPIFVATPTLGFGELIRQTLGNTGRCQVTVVTNGADALNLAAGQSFSIAILDFDLPEGVLPNLLDCLQTSSPDIRLILIPPENDPTYQGLGDYKPNAFLTKPFYLPDLIDTVQDVLGVEFAKPTLDDDPQDEEDVTKAIWRPEFHDPNTVNKPRKQPVKAPGWLQDQNKVVQVLSQCTLELPAQAILVVRYDQLWAATGSLPQAAIQELSRILVLVWARGDGIDLARFVRLESTGGDVMIYATSLGGEYVLALAFEAEIPFSQIRKQAGQLARHLSNEPVTVDVELDADFSEELQTGMRIAPENESPQSQDASFDPVVE